jgi:hypothetical protein
MMWKYAILLSVASALCLGVSCTITGLGDLVGPTQIPLDQADATITVTQPVGAANADVVATITDSHGRVVDLSVDQAVRVNGAALAGPNSAGQYTVTIAVAATYDVTVREPTRGVEDTILDAPGAFGITAPAAGGGASLSGFTLQWSNPNERWQVEIKLTETVFGSVKQATFGPFTDTGSRTLLASDLRDFVQGVDLVVTVTKVDRQTVAGFDTGTGAVRVPASATVSPRP